MEDLYEYIDGKEPDLCACGEKVGDLVGRLASRKFVGNRRRQNLSARF